jgi:hypothetical protein
MITLRVASADVNRKAVFTLRSSIARLDSSYDAIQETVHREKLEVFQRKGEPNGGYVSY